MRVVIQRVSRACVIIGGESVAKTGHGLLVLLGIEEGDTEADCEWLSGKIVRMRLFDDQNDIMNLSARDIGGEILLVSQFTLHASTRKGNRPSYIRAARPETAVPLYERIIELMKSDLGKPIQTGRFGAMMDVELVNDGPVTIILDSKVKE